MRLRLPAMRLRSQILLFLFLFGLAPLIAELAFNLPLVFGTLGQFYHGAYLQSLRADFRDLDQHLASRHELVRLLVKLPDPEGLIGDRREPRIREITRAHFTDLVNRVLQDQVDVSQILILDRLGEPTFWLERDPVTQRWEQGRLLRDRPAAQFVEAGLDLKPGGALISAITLGPTEQRDDPRGSMTLRLISPMFGAPGASASPGAGTAEPVGAVVINIDVGGMAEAYRNTFWVQHDGTYLRYSGPKRERGVAFKDFRGLERIFADKHLALWEGPDRDQVIWVPMFPTEQSGPLWVGRRVDPSPITEFRRQLELRVGGIVLLLIVIVLLVARWIAVRVEGFGRELTEGVGNLLSSGQPVRFRWRGPRELRALARSLTRLAETHADNARALRAHALELERSNRYKSEFLANVSHELRTPLNSILLLSKILADNREPCLTPEQMKQARVIHAAGSDLARLIDDILDLSRIDARKAVLEPDEVDLPALLDELLDLVRPQFEAKGLNLTLSVVDDAPRRIVSDVHKLRQIVKNFLSNAVKFTSRGGVEVRLDRNRGEDAEQCPARIAVSDTGIGIPVAEQANIFEAFAQADGSTSRRYGGTGLGLTISRELAGLLGGRIELHSSEGRGSVFALVLPLRPPAVGDQAVSPANGARRPPAEPAPALPEANFGGGRVLVVDDDMRNLLSLTPLLERWGLEVAGAGDGEEALETLRDDGPFDLVLMDIMMPGMDGYETIERIRAEPECAGLPIIALSARTAPEDRQRCLQVGADDFLPKPVDAPRLKEVLTERLGPDAERTAAQPTSGETQAANK